MLHSTSMYFIHTVHFGEITVGIFKGFYYYYLFLFFTACCLLDVYLLLSQSTFSVSELVPLLFLLLKRDYQSHMAGHCLIFRGIPLEFSTGLETYK